MTPATLRGSLPGSKLAHPSSGASTASAAAVAVNICVLSSQFVAVNAPSFHGIDGGWSFASQDVDLVRHGLHVIGIDASVNPAKMVNHKTIRNSAKLIFIESPMGCYRLSIPLGLPVSIFADFELPNPTWRFISAILFNVGRLGIWRTTSVMTLQEAHRLSDDPSKIWHGFRRAIRWLTATTFTEFDERISAIELRLTALLAFETGQTQPQPRRIRALSLDKSRSIKIPLANGTRAASTLLGHRSGPFARVTRSRWFQPRGGFSLPQLYTTGGAICR
jgi:hypothetical protein